MGFFGQPGVGKSSLINALTGKDLAEVGEGTDTTVREAPYEWNGLLLVDLPGYGTARFPSETYFDHFKVLTLDVTVCITSGKFTDLDTEFFRVTLEGLDDLQSVIVANLPGLKRDRYVRAAKAYSHTFLERKWDACRTFATYAVGAAALGNMLPVPGAGVAADIAALSTIVTKVVADYGIDPSELTALARAADIAPALALVVRDIVAFAGPEGSLWLLKQFAGRVAIAEASKWVPLVGPVLAGSISFILVQQFAFHVIDRCHDYALATLDTQIDAEAEAA